MEPSVLEAPVIHERMAKGHMREAIVNGTDVTFIQLSLPASSLTSLTLPLIPKLSKHIRSVALFVSDK